MIFTDDIRELAAQSLTIVRRAGRDGSLNRA